MNDPDIRALLYPLLAAGVYVDELPTGTTRADVVHITAHFMHGYEVKGDGDTLQRVQNQLRCYGQAYDLVTFVVTPKHVEKLLPLLPPWVGVLVATPAGLLPHRPAGYNATVDRAGVAGLLRLDEIRQFLQARGLPGISALRRRDVLHYLRQAHSIPLSELAGFVRAQLTARLPQRLENRAERKAVRQQRPPRRKRPRHKKPAARRKSGRTAGASK